MATASVGSLCCQDAARQQSKVRICSLQESSCFDQPHAPQSLHHSLPARNSETNAAGANATPIRNQAWHKVRPPPIEKARGIPKTLIRTTDKQLRHPPRLQILDGRTRCITSIFLCAINHSNVVWRPKRANILTTILRFFSGWEMGPSITMTCVASPNVSCPGCWCPFPDARMVRHQHDIAHLRERENATQGNARHPE